MTASGFVRVETETRLIALAGLLDGWQTEPNDDDLWWVTGPMNANSPENARWVVIGNPPDGRVEPAGMQSGQSGSIDAWSITCGLACKGIEDPVEAKQACQDALNQLADMLDANHRLALDGHPSIGCRNLMIEMVEGPFWMQEPGQSPIAWANFNISAQADIVRNRP